MAIVAAFASGCGVQQQLTSAEVDEALAALDAVEQAVDEGRCEDARDAAQRLSNQALQTTGNGDFVSAYRESADRLEELVARQCEEAPSEPTGPTGPTGASEPTGPTGQNDEGTPRPTPPDNNGGQGNPDDGQQQPDDNGGGVGNPDSGGVRPQ